MYCKCSQQDGTFWGHQKEHPLYQLLNHIEEIQNMLFGRQHGGSIVTSQLLVPGSILSSVCREFSMFSICLRGFPLGSPGFLPLPRFQKWTGITARIYSYLMPSDPRTGSGSTMIVTSIKCFQKPNEWNGLLVWNFCLKERHIVCILTEAAGHHTS